MANMFILNILWFSFRWFSLLWALLVICESYIFIAYISIFYFSLFYEYLMSLGIIGTFSSLKINHFSNHWHFVFNYCLCHFADLVSYVILIDSLNYSPFFITNLELIELLGYFNAARLIIGIENVNLFLCKYDTGSYRLGL